MKMKEMNGWDLIESLNNEERVIDGSIYEIQDHNRRRAAMMFMQHKLLKEDETTDPQTGIFFWVPIITPNKDKVSWRIETFFDSQFPEGHGDHGVSGRGLDHATIWSKWANTILGKHESDAPPSVAHRYSGLPRGRVTITARRRYPGGPRMKEYLILHGEDAPVSSAKASKALASAFKLAGTVWKYTFDDHERMQQDDVMVIQRYLGRDLGLLKKAAKFN